jgi:hypothetical protein
MFGYVRGCLTAISSGLRDGIQKTPGSYHGSTEQVALFNAASDALRILVYGPRRS